MMASSRSTIIWSLLWGLLEKCSVQVVSFLVTIVLARLLLPEEYGIVALISIYSIGNCYYRWRTEYCFSSEKRC